MLETWGRQGFRETGTGGSAFGVAEAAARLETLIKNGGDPSEALAELDDAVAQARSAVDAILRRS